MILSGLLSACMADGEVKDVDNEPGAPPPEMTTPEPEPNSIVASKKGLVKAKGGARYGADLAAGLELETDALCKELGQYDCIAEAHNVVLGGVSAYEDGVRSPVSGVPVTAPIAIERIALSACTERVNRDFAGEPVVFGALMGPDAEAETARTEVAEALYRRLLQRNAEPHEIEALVDFWTQLSGPDRVSNWAKLTCFAVATSVEALFY